MYLYWFKTKKTSKMIHWYFCKFCLQLPSWLLRSKTDLSLCYIADLHSNIFVSSWTLAANWWMKESITPLFVYNTASQPSVAFERVCIKVLLTTLALESSLPSQLFWHIAGSAFLGKKKWITCFGRGWIEFVCE